MAGPSRNALPIFALLLPFATVSASEGQMLLQVKTQRAGTILPAEACASLVSHGGTYHSVDVEIGTPGQTFSVVADTGSTTLIVPSCVCRQAGFCRKEDRCFVGINHSSTFAIPGGREHAQSMQLTFVSGKIGGVIARDNASIGSLRAFMAKGFMLMTEKKLNFGGPFEGILGLGLPQGVQSARARSDLRAPTSKGFNKAVHDIMRRFAGGRRATGAPEDVAPKARPIYAWANATAQIPGAKHDGAAPTVVMPPGFLEQAGIDRFSMCFNYEGDGVLRLGTPPSASGHGSLSTIHWGLGLWGLSVGKTDAPVQVCLPQDKGPGQKSPCGAIADSGTTFLMGPADHIAALLDTVCDQWDRCARNYSAMVKATRHADEVLVKDYGVNPFRMAPVQKSLIAKLLLMDCDRWLDEADGLDELPPIGFHIRGSNSTEQTLSLPARAYVVQHDVNGSLAAKMNSGIKRICSPSLGAIEYRTADTGPVWILGAPLFYEFNVGYDMLATPPAMAFASVGREPCGGCDKKIGLVATAAESNASRAKWPRIISGPSRLPTSIGVHWPM